MRVKQEPDSQQSDRQGQGIPATAETATEGGDGKGFLQGWYISVARGIFAFLLGILLLVNPGGTQWSLLQYMGVFWLTTGLTSIAWARPRGRRTRWVGWSLAAGILGVLAGLIALLRPILTQIFATWVIISLIGAFAIITGLLHIFGGFKTGSKYGPHWSWGLGVVALTSPWEPIPVGWLIASGWCLITGLLMVLDARRLRARAYSDGAVDQE
jgi:uncharacterized membrane protein HdeD (DUF308 family)